jgi:hypothetical protein
VLRDAHLSLYTSQKEMVGVKPNVPIIRNRYTILDIAPPAGSWALALSSALDTHQSLLTYTPRPAPRGAARGSLSLNFITRVAPHCVNTLMILHAAHTLMMSAG